MAVKITGLPSGSIPLSGGELLEMVQNGVSYYTPVSAIDHNTISNLQGGTTSEYYHLTAYEEGFIAATSERIDIGDNTATYVRVDNDDNDIEFDISNNEMLRISSSGLRVGGSAGTPPTFNEVLESVNDTISPSATDSQLATAKLIYTFVAAISAARDDHNELKNIQGGIPSASEYYHLSQSIHDGLFSASPTIGLGSSIGTNLEVDYGNHTIKADANTSNIMNLKGSTQQIGLSAAERIVVDQTSNAIQMTAFSSEQGSLVQAIDIDGPNNALFLGDQSQMHAKVEIGSAAAVFIKSGTTDWLTVSDGSVTVGENTLTGTKMSATNTPAIRMWYKGDRFFQMEDTVDAFDNRLMIGDWTTPSHNQLVDVTIAASGAELTTKLDRIFASMGGTKVFDAHPNTLTLGLSGAERIHVDQTNDAIQMTVFDNEQNALIQAIDIDGVSSIMYLGDQTQVHTRVGIGSNAAFRVMSGTDEWISVQGGSVNVGNATVSGTYMNVGTTPRLSMNYKGDRVFQLEDSTGTHDNRFMIGDWGTPSHNEILDITIAASGAELTTKLDRIFASMGGTKVFDINPTTITIGVSADTKIEVDHANNTALIDATILTVNNSSHARLYIGADNSNYGSLFIYGDDGEFGAKFRLYNPGDEDGTVDYYEFNTDSTNGHLRIGPNTDTDALTYDDANAKWIMDGSTNGVELLHASNKKFETSPSGATVTGILVTDGVSMDANEFIQFGTAVAGSGGRMFFDATDLVLQNGDGTAGFISCTNGAAVALRYNNSNKISTSATGALINGVIICDGMTMGDGEDITFGLGPDAKISSDGTSLVIENGAGTATMAKFTQTTAAELYYNNVKTFETISNGALVSRFLNVGVDDTAFGTINVYGTDEDVGGTLHLYNAADADATADFWKFQSEESGGSSKLIIHNNTGGSGEFIVLDEFTGNISLKYAGADTFVTTSVGAEVTGEFKHLNISTVTAQTTASNSDVILASAAPSGFAVYLQDSTRASITVKRIDNSANTTVQGLSGNIDGAATKELTVQYQSETFIWDGTNWFIL